ncbi:MAG: hypothetical protein HC887_10865 [Desulfobacteraceae bacterium]|nr:hypothetical protein [Desulfobacteraceae bacterium]
MADTWAHQDFTGGQSPEINGAGYLNWVYADFQRFEEFQEATFKNTVKKWFFMGDDNDCAAAPLGSPGFKGHGQMGHYPDYGWLRIIYPPAWIKDSGYLLRNNPQQFTEAWKELAWVMSVCNSGNVLSGNITIDPDIRDAIRKKIPLSTTTLQAIKNSQNNWKDNTKKGSQLLPLDETSLRKYGTLGVQGDWLGELANTRLGTVNVREGSYLHMFELAAAIHYQWCVRWSQAHPYYFWKIKPERDPAFGSDEYFRKMTKPFIIRGVTSKG